MGQPAAFVNVISTQVFQVPGGGKVQGLVDFVKEGSDLVFYGIDLGTQVFGRGPGTILQALAAV